MGCCASHSLDILCCFDNTKTNERTHSTNSTMFAMNLVCMKSYGYVGCVVVMLLLLLLLLLCCIRHAMRKMRMQLRCLQKNTARLLILCYITDTDTERMANILMNRQIFTTEMNQTYGIKADRQKCPKNHAIKYQSREEIVTKQLKFSSRAHLVMCMTFIVVVAQ